MQSRQNYPNALQLQRRATMTSWDPFAINPVRRSLIVFIVCAMGFIVPMTVFPPGLEATTMVLFGWMAAVGMVLALPVFLMSSAEWAWKEIDRRIHPSVDLLDVSPRVRNLLNRYGFRDIDNVDRTPDDVFLMLSNFDPKALHELRRAVNLWRYRRWQEAGFPADWR